MTDPHQAPATYVFGNQWQNEDQRLALMEAGWDPHTIENLTLVGRMTGWRCLEVGAGHGSVARWLAQQVGPTGSVVATDLDLQLLAGMPGPANLELRRHDITTQHLEPGAYDLVHTRLVLEHLPERADALRHMVEALKPGGWLVAEEFDHVTMAPATRIDPVAQQAWDRFMAAFHRLSEQRSLDLEYGRRLPGDLGAAGLTSVRSQGRAQFNAGAGALSRVLSLSIERMADPLLATGAVSAPELQRLITLLEDPAFAWMSQLMVVAWGRRAE